MAPDRVRDGHDREPIGCLGARPEPRSRAAGACFNHPMSTRAVEIEGRADRPGKTPSTDRSFLVMVFAGVLLIYLALLPPGMFQIDANSMADVAASLATSLDFSIPCQPFAVPGRGGACFSPYYPLLSVVSAPVIGLGIGVGSLLDLPPSYLGKVVALVVPAAAGAGAAAFCAAIALELGASRRGAVAAATALALGTETLTYARTFFAETLCALLVAAAVWLATQRGRRGALGLACFGLAVLAKPTMVAVGPAVGAARALAQRRLKPLLALGAATAAGGLLYLGYNWLRFGDLLDFGGTRPGFGEPEDRSFSAENFGPLDVVEGIGILLVSPGRGLLWFSPVALLGAFALWRRRRDPLAASCLGATVGLVLLHSGFPGSGFEWGTRYLVAVLPLLCAGLALLRGRTAKVAVGLAVIGLLIQAPVIVALPDRWPAEAEARGISNGEVYWALPPKRIVESWPAAGRQLRAAARSDPRELVAAAGRDRGGVVPPVEEQQFLRVVSLWWWMLPLVGIPPWVGALVAVVAVAGGGLILWRAATGGGRVHATPGQP